MRGGDASTLLRLDRTGPMREGAARNPAATAEEEERSPAFVRARLEDWKDPGDGDD
jgi:hypothetical protein